MMTEKAKELRRPILFTIIFLLPLTSIFWNWIFKIGLLAPITNYSHGLITQTLIANIISIIFYSIFIFYFGKLSLESLLINKKKLQKAAVTGLLTWGLTILLLIGVKKINNSSIDINPQYIKEIGLTVGQMFGNVPFEEMIFRGILFFQFYLIFVKNTSRIKSIVFSIILSSLIFSLIHIPNRLLIYDVSNLLTDCIATFILGSIFCILFYWRKNLFHVVIIHSFLNYPLFIINTDNLPINLIFCLMYIGLMYFDKDKTPRNTGFASGGLTCKLGTLCF